MVFLLALITAVLPVWVWYTILIRKHREGMRFFFWTSFVLGAVFAGTFIHFEANIESFFKNNLSLGILLSSILIGVLIEYGKNWIVRIVGGKYFKGIDDVVDLSFATAIGFTFYENFLEFIELYSQKIDYETPIEILKEVLNREFFILPIHLCVSGIFGFYYGMSLFGGMNSEENMRPKFFSKRLLILKGTILSTVIYGLFFMFSTMDPKMSDVIGLLGFKNFPLNERLIPVISFVFFSLSSLFLFIKLAGQRSLFRKNLQKPKK